MKKTTVVLVVVAALTILVSYIPVHAADIVSLPTANQLKMGQVDVADYQLSLDLPPGWPTSANLAIVCIGLPAKLELDVWHDAPNRGFDTVTSVNASFQVLSENIAMPDVVIGAQNITRQPVAPGADNVSLFVAAAKTINLPIGGLPKFPIVRAHLGFGTKHNSGVFGGVQIRVAPSVGVALLRSQFTEKLVSNYIAAITYDVPKAGITVKAGTLGKHTWIGASYLFDARRLLGG